MSALGYNDIWLTPKYSTLKSRSEADINVEFLGRRFKAPWMPANMESVIDEKIAKWLSENDYFYIMHRFGNTYEFVKKANAENWKTVSISVGVKKEDEELLYTIVRENLKVDFITIDIAHGHSLLVKKMIEFIRNLDFKSHQGDYISDSMAIRRGIAGKGRPFTSVSLSYKPKIIAGNVATPEAVRDLTEWDADAIKVGIAGGAACSTKHQTGFHIPMFSCVKNCSNIVVKWGGYSWERDGYNPPKHQWPINAIIIADGGIRENGDIPKALVAGATMVMAGSLFAACENAPGENIYPKGYWREWLSGDCVTKNRAWENGPLYKSYHGSASAKQKGERKHVEGHELEIPCNGMTYTQKYEELSQSLKSAISYAGGNSLDAFKSVSYQSTK